MDRNPERFGDTLEHLVALRKESVDRNAVGMAAYAALLASLSARRAWIEIQFPVYGSRWEVSLSARRAWIEILIDDYVRTVAKSLSARRAWIEIAADMRSFGGADCRSPQGERG